MKTEILELIENAKAFDKTKNFAFLAEIVDKYKKEQYHTTPSKFSFNSIRTTGETAYQRAIFLSKKATLENLGEVAWNDLELPVVFGKNSRRRCVDLIGTLSNSTSVLCELKYASQKSCSSTDSPVYAVIELLIYYYLIRDNNEELDKKKVFHKNEQVIPFKWSDFNYNSIFIVGANKKYWNYWLKRYEKQEIGSWLESLPLKVRFFSSENFCFKEQKGNKEEYTPSVLGKTEWTEVFVK